ncbi:cyanophycin synthetase family protein [Comamonas kerstersii]|uniref:Cyanophycin synthetase n=1 Tax=Comamonas kerstersii TaxID=225992 RepID=A0A1V3TME1_9BURK|nr:acetate--CoA ligase family protein [Comamonas kerstersii]AQZ97512.1 cyanophycin synthetase [Comamonas kerstersii]OOH87468.1 cyanophycin synthetase [Comamonas kerstersii]OOH95808.1 cyanophycin synthetase [Comamonas kerstersii]
MATFKDIQLLRTTYLRGPSVWTYRPVLEVWLDLGELEDYPSNKIDGFTERLTAWLPGLVEHHCGVGHRGGFIERLQEGTWCGHVMEHTIIELLNMAGMPAEFGQTRSVSQRGVYRMVFRCPEESVAHVALNQGHALIMAAINNQPFDVQAAVEAIKAEIENRYLGPSTASIVNAAAVRRIPFIRLNDGNLVQLGYGAAQRRVWSTETDKTSAIGFGIAEDKDLSKQLLKACGVPVPEWELVKSADDAWEEADYMGLPVTVKPYNSNKGEGVSVNLTSEAEVRAAYDEARKLTRYVMVERFVPGHVHRLLVVGGKVVAASRGEYPNGQHDPRAKVVTVDCTDDVHPEVAYMAALSAKVVGLDIAGVDLVCQDISKPLEAQGGAILEVNGGPGLLMHLKPSVGVARPVGQAIVEHLFPSEDGDSEGLAARIPVVGIAGTRHNAFIARLVGWLLQLSGKRTGVASSEGTFLEGRLTQKGDNTNWHAAHRLLVNRLAEAAVIQTSARSILEEGLAYDRCQVGVVTDMDGYEALANHDIHEAEQMTRVLRTQIDVVLTRGAGVLNADDAQTADLARLCDGQVLFYSLDASNATVAAHREAGGRAVLLKGEEVVLVQDSTERVLGTLTALRPVNGFEPDHAALLAAVATAWALDITPELIAAGIKTFDYQAA